MFLQRKYLRRREQVRLWMEAVLQERLLGNWCYQLTDGQKLCKLMLAVKDRSVPYVNTSKLHFKVKENILFFLTACRDLGIPPWYTFEISDLCEGKNFIRVFECLEALGKTIEKDEDYEGPLYSTLSNRVVITEESLHNFDENTLCLLEANKKRRKTQKLKATLIKQLEEEVAIPLQPFVPEENNPTTVAETPETLPAGTSEMPVTTETTKTPDTTDTTTTTTTTTEIPKTLKPDDPPQTSILSMTSVTRTGPVIPRLSLLVDETSQPDQQVATTPTTNVKLEEKVLLTPRGPVTALVSTPRDFGMKSLVIPPRGAVGVLSGIGVSKSHSFPNGVSAEAFTGETRLLIRNSSRIALFGTLNQLRSAEKKFEGLTYEEKLGALPGIIRLQALIRGRIARKLYESMVVGWAYRNNVAKEILSSERTYVKNLRTLIHCYLKPLRAAAETGSPIMSHAQIRKVFSCLEVIVGYNERLLMYIEERVEKNWGPYACLGDIFIQINQFMKTYTQYVTDYNDAITIINECKKSNPAFAQFLRQMPKHPGSKNNDLLSLMIMPVQRIPRYELLLSDLVKHTPKNHPDYENLQNAYLCMHSISLYMEDKKREAENVYKVTEIQKKVIGEIKLALPHRRYVRHGPMIELPARKESTFFLFNDILLSTKKFNRNRLGKSEEYYKERYWISIADCKSVCDLPDTPNKQSCFFLVHHDGSIILICSCNSQEDKKRWVDAFNRVLKAPSGNRPLNYINPNVERRRGSRMGEWKPKNSWLTFRFPSIIKHDEAQQVIQSATPSTIISPPQTRWTKITTNTLLSTDHVPASSHQELLLDIQTALIHAKKNDVRKVQPPATTREQVCGSPSMQTRKESNSQEEAKTRRRTQSFDEATAPLSTETVAMLKALEIHFAKDREKAELSAAKRAKKKNDPSPPASTSTSPFSSTPSSPSLPRFVPAKQTPSDTSLFHSDTSIRTRKNSKPPPPEISGSNPHTIPHSASAPLVVPNQFVRSMSKKFEQPPLSSNPEIRPVVSAPPKVNAGVSNKVKMFDVKQKPQAKKKTKVLEEEEEEEGEDDEWEWEYEEYEVEEVVKEPKRSTPVKVK